MLALDLTVNLNAVDADSLGHKETCKHMLADLGLAVTSRTMQAHKMTAYSAMVLQVSSTHPARLMSASTAKSQPMLLITFFEEELRYRLTVGS